MKSILSKTLVIAALISPALAYCQDKQTYHPPYFIDQTRLQKIQASIPLVNKLYQTYAEQNHFPGYAFGIVVDGHLIYTGGGGYANLDKKIPVKAQSYFRMASMTKSFTAMAILKLRDQGKLRLDDPVYLYIPALKDQHLSQDAPVITIRDLLTHSSGLPQDDPWGDRQLERSDKDLLALIQRGVSFSTVSGTHYEYSNLAFTLLGYIIQKVSGIPFQEYISKNICQPLGMKCAWEYSQVPSAQLVQGYKWIDGSWQPEKLLHNGIYGAMGGMIISVDSFGHYEALHQLAWPPRDESDNGPLKRSSLREMHQSWRFNNLDPHYKDLSGKDCPMTSSYAYGLEWMHDCEDKTFVGHTGGLPGFGSNWLFLPEYGLGVVLFANVTYAPAEEINLQVLNTLVYQAGLQPRQLPVSAILKQRKEALLKVLPDWQDAEHKGIFAENFFLDSNLERRKQESQLAFARAGKIVRVGELVPENQLRGYFVLKGEKANIKVSFTLSPQSPALIQKLQIEIISA